MNLTSHPEETDWRVSYEQAVTFWRLRRRQITPTFVCPQWECGVINCPAFMADLQHHAMLLSEREEFVRLNGFEPEILLKKVRDEEGTDPTGVLPLRPADLQGSGIGGTREVSGLWSSVGSTTGRGGPSQNVHRKGRGSK